MIYRARGGALAALHRQGCRLAIASTRGGKARAGWVEADFLFLAEAPSDGALCFTKG
jgi:hypothetical protein